jgi:hypothetical protein
MKLRARFRKNKRNRSPIRRLTAKTLPPLHWGDGAVAKAARLAPKR